MKTKSILLVPPVVFALASLALARLFAVFYPPNLPYWLWISILPLAFLSAVYLVALAYFSKKSKQIADEYRGARMLLHGGPMRHSKGDGWQSVNEPEGEPESAPKVAIGTEPKHQIRPR